MEGASLLGAETSRASLMTGLIQRGGNKKERIHAQKQLIRE